MVLNGYGMGDGETATPVTTGTTSSWGDIAKGLVQTAVPALVKQIGPNGQVTMVPAPASSSGIPTPIIIIGAGVLGLVLWKMMSKKSRPAVSNPRRRRGRHGRRSRRRGR